MIKKIKIGKYIFSIDKSGNSASYYCSKKVNICVNQNLIKKLISIYKRYKKTFRICLHNNNKQKIHCMIVVMGKKDKTKIHKHVTKTEYYYIHHGKMNLFVKDGQKNKYQKNLINCKTSIFCKINNQTYHQVVPKSDIVVFSEIRDGPFKQNDSIILKE
jgi:cupin fold WbuC family metalloprotein